MVVEGAPGIGKSTLVLELCHQWTLLKQFSVVLLLKLREKNIQSYTDLFFYTDNDLKKVLVKEASENNNGEGILFIFDGFDELPNVAEQQDSLR